MSNSSLVTYTKITNNRKSPREAKIDTIAIHCMVAQWTAKQACDYFAGTSRQASANYCVGKDGSIGLSVPESDRAWTTSSQAVDKRAVTIEVASDLTYPYAVTDAAYAALIKLCADICRRNGIKKMVWSTNMTERKTWANGCNMAVHRDWANKSCPGEYLYSRMGDIAAKVNALLDGGGAADVTENPNSVSTAAKENEKEVYEVNVRTLKKGCKGQDVFALQAFLKCKGYYNSTVDGDFGAVTEAAVKTFQKVCWPNDSSQWDGIAGKYTLGKIWSV